MKVTITRGFEQAANVNRTEYISHEQDGEYDLDSIGFTPNSDGALALDGTNYITVTVKQGSDTIATWNTNTGGTAHVAGTRIAPTLTGGARLRFGPSDLLIVDIVKSGSGGVFKGTLSASFKKVQADVQNTIPTT